MEKATWYVPASRMKADRDHVVPLSAQALALLAEIKRFSGAGRYVFPSWSHKKKPITTNALVGVFRKLGYASTLQDPTTAFTTHGFRGLGSTTLHQHPNFAGFKSDWIEHQLAHTEKDKVKAAYNQLTPWSYIDERRAMLQAYADYLDSLREAASKE